MELPYHHVVMAALVALVALAEVGCAAVLLYRFREALIRALPLALGLLGFSAIDFWQLVTIRLPIDADGSWMQSEPVFILTTLGAHLSMLLILVGIVLVGQVSRSVRRSETS